MFKRKIAWLCAIVLIVGCFGLAGCGSDGDEESWDGTYTCTWKDEDVDDQNHYVEVEVAVEDGFMMVEIKDHNNGGMGDDYSSEYNGEGDYKESKNGKTITIPFDEGYTSDAVAELRRLSGKYYLSIKGEDHEVVDKFEVEKNVKKKVTSATPAPTTTKKIEVTTTKKAKKTKKKSSSVSSDFKKTMDDYEDFIDDYVAFMKKYKKASAAKQAAMLSDYSDMMSKYSELSSEMSDMKSDLSSDELAYYTKVMARVAKKLAKVQ